MKRFPGRCRWQADQIGVLLVILSWALGAAGPCLGADKSIYRYWMTVKSSPSHLLPSQIATIPIFLVNTSGEAWPSSESNPVGLNYHWLDATGTTVVHDGDRTLLPEGFRTGMVRAKVKAPAEPGNYTCVFDQ